MTLNQYLFQWVAASQFPPASMLESAYFLAQWGLWLAPITLILLWIVGGHQDRLIAVRATLTGLVALAMAGAVSALYMHPRPFMDGLAPNRLDHLPDSSFPSDHATLLLALAVAFYLNGPPLYPRLWISAISLALLVAWSRVYLGVHYPFDMVGALGFAWIAAMIMQAPISLVISQQVARLGEFLYAAITNVARG